MEGLNEVVGLRVPSRCPSSPDSLSKVSIDYGMSKESEDVLGSITMGFYSESTTTRGLYWGRLIVESFLYGKMLWERWFLSGKVRRTLLKATAS